MPWEGEDRRRRITGDTGQRRRRGDLKEAWGRIEGSEEDVENLHTMLTGLINSVRDLAGQVGEVRGELKAVSELCRGIDGKADKATSFKNAVQFAAVVIVPVLVALIGAYALLKAQAPQALPK